MNIVPRHCPKFRCCSGIIKSISLRPLPSKPNAAMSQRNFSAIEDRLQEQLDRRRREGTLRSLMPIPASSQSVHQQQFQPPSTQPVIDFASNDYLGFARCPEQHIKVQNAYQKLFSPYLKNNAWFAQPTSQWTEDASQNESQQQQQQQNNQLQTQLPPMLGATGSRLLSGDSTLARSLEAYLASPSVHNREAALLFNSGYDANLSILSSLPYRNKSSSDSDEYGDAIVMDELVHNSLVMGVRMGRLDRNRVFLFRHNDVSDLRRVLNSISSYLVPKSSEQSTPSVVIVVESVYSMDGDISPLKEILDVAHEKGASVMVDEAHGLGVYGCTNVHDLYLKPSIGKGSVNTYHTNYKAAQQTNSKDSLRGGGTGVLAALNLEHHPSLLCSIHTFGKAAGCHGAVVAGSQTLISYLVNYARPFVYSTALPPHSLITIQQSYESMLGSEGERRRKLVFELVQLFRDEMMKGLSQLEAKFPGMNFDLLPSPSPIQAVIVPGNELCISVCQYLRNVGRLDVYPIRSPTVAKGKERIRIILHSHNTKEEVQDLVDSLLASLRRAMLHPDTNELISKL